MFKKPSTTPFHSSSGDTTFIAAECQITGSIKINGNARIDGKIEGTIIATGDLIIGTSALLEANIEANTLSLAGEIRGNIKTTDLLELNATARLFGDICTSQLKVEKGAHFEGKSQLLENTTSVINEKSKEQPLTKENKSVPAPA